MYNSQSRALGVIIEMFSNYLEKIVFKSKEPEINEKSLNHLLKKSSELTIKDFYAQSFKSLKLQLKYVEIRTLDLWIEFVYENCPDKTNVEFCEKLLQIIEYGDSKSSEISVIRSNVKKSIEHGMRDWFK